MFLRLNVKVTHWLFTDTYIYAEVDGVSNQYIIRIDSDGFSCSCQDNSIKHMRDYQYKCKHLNLVFNQILQSEFFTKRFINIMNQCKNGEKLNMPFLKSGLKCIDTLFGGIPYKILFGLAGVPESGKTTLLIKLLYHILFYESTKANGEGINVAIIDGEGGMYDAVIDKFMKTYNDQYDADFGVDLWQMNYTYWEDKKIKKSPMIHVVDSKKKHKIHIIDLVENDDGISAYFNLMLLVGKPKSIVTSKKGQKLTKDHPRQDEYRNIKTTPIGSFVEKHNIKAIGLDSLTMIMEVEHASGTEGFPSRAKDNMQVCHNLQRLISTYKMYGIVNHHLTKNPQQGIFAVPMMTGGKGTRHNFKFQAGMELYGGLKPHASKRWIGILRHPHKARGTKKLIEITNEGIADRESPAK